jgi:hypothetical protein
MRGDVGQTISASVYDDAERYEGYLRYIASPEWRNSAARLQELEASGYRCRLCNASGEEDVLHVHHRTYASLFAELADDLTTLCARCHRDVTSIIRARRYSKLIPKRADVVSPLGSSKPIEDPIHGTRFASIRQRYDAPDRASAAPDARRAPL